MYVQWSCIFGVTRLKMTSLRVTSLLYSEVNLSLSSLSFSNLSYQKYKTNVVCLFLISLTIHATGQEMQGQNYIGLTQALREQGVSTYLFDIFIIRLICICQGTLTVDSMIENMQQYKSGWNIINLSEKFHIWMKQDNL